MVLNIPVWLLVLVASVAPFAGVWFWSNFIRRSGGDYDFGVDIVIYGLVAIVIGLIFWIVYLALT